MSIRWQGLNANRLLSYANASAGCFHLQMNVMRDGERVENKTKHHALLLILSESDRFFPRWKIRHEIDSVLRF